MSRVLVVGGTHSMGYQLVWRLLAARHAVTILNRGQHPDPFGNRVDRIHVDRQTSQFGAALAGHTFDAAVDFAAYSAADAAGAVAALMGRVGHYVFVSSGAVYLVRDGAEPPFEETSYDGPLVPEPAAASLAPTWHYGMGKRAAEDTLSRAHAEQGFPATVLRLPTVTGERDTDHLAVYLWRMLDGGPLLVPDAGASLTRHVYSGDVAQAAAALLGRGETIGRAYNLSQDEQPTVAELLTLAAAQLGAPLRLVGVGAAVLEAAGLNVRQVSPFSSPWSSRLTAARAQQELGFRPTPIGEYLGRVVAAWLAHPPMEPPEGYEHRARELEVASAAS